MIPRIIRTQNELAALDPNTLVTAELPTRDESPAVVWGADVAYGLGLIWRGPMVVIATGEQARAARQALEEEA